MKTLAELFEIIGVAVGQNGTNSHHFFIDYMGHINKLSVKYYLYGWHEESVHADRIEVKLTEDGIQSAYWFIKTKLN